MIAFFRETLQLFYYAYFKPSALQARVSQVAPQKEGDTNFLQLSVYALRSASGRWFLLQCLVWWLLGLIPFWWLAWGEIPWEGMLLVSGSLLLGAWGIGIYDLPLGLAFPSLAGLVWGLKPGLWLELQSGATSLFQEQMLGWLVTNLTLGAVFGGTAAAWAAARGHERLVVSQTGLTTFVAVGVVFVVTGVVTGGEAVVVAGVIMVSVAGGVAGGVADGEAVVVASVVASVVAFSVAGGVAGVVAVGIAAGVEAGAVAVGVVFGVAVIVAFSVAFVVAFGVASVVASVVAGIVAGIVAFGMAGIVASSVAFGVTLTPALTLSLTLGLGMALSPRRSALFGSGFAAVALFAFFGLFFEAQGPGPAGLALLIFLTGYFRIPFYPVALTVMAAIIRWSHWRQEGTNALVRRLPPFTDEIVWLRLFGLDQVLVAAVKEDLEQGREAIQIVAESFRQRWAVQRAMVQVSVQELVRYSNVNQITSAPEAFNWLPNEPEASLRGVIEARRRIGGVGQEIKAALGATSDYNRLWRLNRARKSVGDWQKSVVALNDREYRRFVPVAERWERLIDEEINRLSAKGEIEAHIPNPYITGLPVQSDEVAMFAPRPDLVRAVENALNTLHGKPTLALYGPRRMGKSTFLLHLPRLLTDDVVPVFVDLQAAVQVSGLGGLFYNWAIAACDAARDQRRLTLPRPALADFSSEPAIAWREWLDEAEDALGERKLFFTFDEFERLVDQAEKNPALEGTFDILRHLSQHRPRVYLLFAGAHHLEKLAPGGRWHDYFINVRGLEVSYLDEQGARRLLTNPIEDFPLDYAPDAVDEVVRLTRCQPMLVQLMGSILVDWLNSPKRRQQGEWRVATMEDVAHAASEILSVGHSAYFANLWEDAGGSGRQLLGALSQSSEGLRASELARVSGLPEQQMLSLVTRLEQYQLIEQVGDQWRVQVELTRRAFAGFARREDGRTFAK